VGQTSTREVRQVSCGRVRAWCNIVHGPADCLIKLTPLGCTGLLVATASVGGEVLSFRSCLGWPVMKQILVHKFVDMVQVLFKPMLAIIEGSWPPLVCCRVKLPLNFVELTWNCCVDCSESNTKRQTWKFCKLEWNWHRKLKLQVRPYRIKKLVWIEWPYLSMCPVDTIYDFIFSLILLVDITLTFTYFFIFYIYFQEMMLTLCTMLN